MVLIVVVCLPIHLLILLTVGAKSRCWLSTPLSHNGSPPFLIVLWCIVSSLNRFISLSHHCPQCWTKDALTWSPTCQVYWFSPSTQKCVFHIVPTLECLSFKLLGCCIFAYFLIQEFLMREMDFNKIGAYFNFLCVKTISVTLYPKKSIHRLHLETSLEVFHDCILLFIYFHHKLKGYYYYYHYYYYYT